ncbi:hypothetical protein L083_3638 [Actinoplanes sp. N902-109]|nr:hypothetical protein L083_3638 [Actinoplanes sp. N902-109]
MTVLRTASRLLRRPNCCKCQLSGLRAAHHHEIHDKSQV